MHDGRRRIIAAANPAAGALGLRPGMAVAQALAIVPGLMVADAEPEADRDALERLARWCHRLSPLVSVDGVDGLWLDIAGCAHLHGGEPALLDSVLTRLGRDGLHASAAVADTPGAAHALARHRTGVVVVPPGEHPAAIAPLPVAALRLTPELEATLRRLGFDRVQQLGRIPRALLARRFGPLPGLRLDQALGRVDEPLAPLMPTPVLQHRSAFLEPLLTAEGLAIAITQGVTPLCEEMERNGLGARQVDVMFERVDGHCAALRIGTVRPSRDAGHLSRMLAERLETIDPGLGIEAMQTLVLLAEPLVWEQQEGRHAPQSVGRLVDRLTNRLGEDRVFQASPVESGVPERSTKRRTPSMGQVQGPVVLHAAANPSLMAQRVKPAISERQSSQKPSLTLVSSEESDLPRTLRPEGHLRLVVSGVEAAIEQDPPVLDWKRPWAHRRLPLPKPTSWPARLHAPARLLDPPRPVEALAALPDQPPIAFTWRRRRFRVRRAEGPERVSGEWWKGDGELSVRDYFQVEDDTGLRFWLFREGNGLDPRTGDLSWFLHGLF